LNEFSDGPIFAGGGDFEVPVNLLFHLGSQFDFHGFSVVWVRSVMVFLSHPNLIYFLAVSRKIELARLTIV
jgi:hypothetical protein